MNTQDLVRMANQIVDYYQAYPEDEAVAGIAAHIRSFWDPRMRSVLENHVAGGGAGLKPLALKAVKQMTQAAA
jgi:formate dehydrogenase subunit delta